MTSSTGQSSLPHMQSPGEPVHRKRRLPNPVPIIISLAIVAFWAFMMTKLVKREIFPAIERAQAAKESFGYERLEELAKENYVSQMGIFFGERRIGTTRAEFSKAGDETHIRNKTRLSLNLGGGGPLTAATTGFEGLDLSITFRAEVYEGQLRHFHTTIRTPGEQEALLIMDGRPIDDILSLNIRQGDTTQKQDIPFDANQFLANSYGPVITPENLRVGERWQIRTFDPGTKRITAAWATVTAREEITVEGRTYNTYVVKIPFAENEMTVWVAPDGTVLKQKLLIFTFIYETPTEEEDTQADD